MCIYMCIYMYICICVSVYIYTYMCIYIYQKINTYVCTKKKWNIPEKSKTLNYSSNNFSGRFSFLLLGPL